MSAVRKFVSIQKAPAASEPFNVARKIYHAFGLVIPLVVYFDAFAFFAPGREHLTREICIVLLAAGILLMLCVDTLRFQLKPLNRLFVNVVGSLLKEEEKKRYNATIPYFTACLLLLWFFSDVTATLACIFLMVGDPFAAYVGGHYGRVRFWNGKSLEGLLAFMGAGFIGSILFLAVHLALAGDAAGPFALNTQAAPVIVLAGLGCAALAEFLSIVALRGLFDDNLIVPLFGAGGMALCALVMNDVDVMQLYFDSTGLFA